MKKLYCVTIQGSKSSLVDNIMPRPKLTKKIIASVRKEIILFLANEGWTDQEIGLILNNMDRSTVFRIRTEQTHKKER